LKRLDEVRDIFIFSCYTGIAYIDLFNLSQSSKQVGIDGEPWVFSSRQKTGTSIRIPLLPQAFDIIKKYETHPVVEESGKLLPVISNQKMNAYLKEIAVLCGIEKTLTFHIARHTFATTVALSNDVPIETVSMILGHTSIKTTQIYSKVVETKISNDMKALKEKLLSKSSKKSDTNRIPIA